MSSFFKIQDIIKRKLKIRQEKWKKGEKHERKGFSCSKVLLVCLVLPIKHKDKFAGLLVHIMVHIMHRALDHNYISPGSLSSGLQHFTVKY